MENNYKNTKEFNLSDKFVQYCTADISGNFGTLVMVSSTFEKRSNFYFKYVN